MEGSRTADDRRAAGGAAQRRLRAEHAFEHIKTLLLDGRFQPGERLPVDALVRELGVSRQPVMDALKRLAAENMLEIIPQVGCRVVLHDAREIQDFFQLFASGEGMLAGLAAQRGSAAGGARLREIVRRAAAVLAALSDEQRAVEYRMLNREFHGHIHRMAQSAVLVRLTESLWDRTDFYISTAAGRTVFPERVVDAQREHELICDAVLARDDAAARRAMEAHVLEFRSRILAGMTEDGSAGLRPRDR